MYVKKVLILRNLRIWKKRFYFIEVNNVVSEISFWIMVNCIIKCIKFLLVLMGLGEGNYWV